METQKMYARRFRMALASRLYRPRTVRSIELPGLGEVQFALHSLKDPWVSDPIEKGYPIEWNIYQLLREFLKEGGSLLDIGANLGWFTIIGSRLVGNRGHVLAVEPDPFNLRLLKTNVRLNGCRNVKIFPVAVGDRNHNAILHRSPDSQADHQLAVESDRPDRVKVRVTSIDSLFRSGLPRVDFIKIDTQGSEAAILRGMSGFLSQNPKVRIVFEFWPRGLQNCGSSVDEFAKLLRRLGGRYWYLHWDNTTEPVDPDGMIELGRTRYAPATGHHTDIVRAWPEDRPLIEYLSALQRAC